MTPMSLEPDGAKSMVGARTWVTKHGRGVLWLCASTGLIQLLDGYVGMQVRDARTTWGPIGIVLQFAALAGVAFGASRSAAGENIRRRSETEPPGAS